MAKKKQRKNTKKEKPTYLVELYGILLILVAILGIGKYGPIGRGIASFALFLVGNLYFFLLVTVLIVGGYIIINRKGINLLSSKMIGVYLFVIGLVVLMHQNYVLDNMKTDKIFSETIDYIMLGIEKIMNKSVQVGIFNEALANTGGGLLGAIFASLFYFLFEAQGTKIVIPILMISGFMIFTGLSIKDILDKGKETAENIKHKHHKQDKEPKEDNSKSKFKIVDHNDEGENKDKLVVHDIKELTKVPEKSVVSNQTPKTNNINKSYTVGSVVKAATISIGYKYNIIDIGTSVYDSCVKLKNKTQKCSWKNLGRVNDLRALQESSNYYQFLIAIGLTGEKYKYNMSLNNLDYAFKVYRDTLASYGLGSITVIDLDNENIGIICKTISDDLLLNLSIGQYDTYTPIELTQYINTVANNGNRIALSLMKEIVNEKGEIVLKNESKVLNTVDLEDKYKNRIKEGLRNVSLYGTGSFYIDKKYKASSKTGTSESVLDTDKDGISDTYATTRTFVSYMPSDEPIYSLVIVSPNIDYKEIENTRTYPINMYLSRQVSKILFDN